MMTKTENGIASTKKNSESAPVIYSTHTALRCKIPQRHILLKNNSKLGIS